MTNFINDRNLIVEDGFLEKYCKKFKCKHEDFEKKVLWRCMYTVSWPLARLVWLVDRDFFRADLDLINELRNITSFAQIRDIISFYSIQPQKKNYLRRLLRIRMSKSKLMKLARSVLRKSDAD